MPWGNRSSTISHQLTHSLPAREVPFGPRGSRPQNSPSATLVALQQKALASYDDCAAERDGLAAGERGAHLGHARAQRIHLALQQRHRRRQRRASSTPRGVTCQNSTWPSADGSSSRNIRLRVAQRQLLCGSWFLTAVKSSIRPKSDAPVPVLYDRRSSRREPEPGAVMSAVVPSDEEEKETAELPARGWGKWPDIYGRGNALGDPPSGGEVMAPLRGRGTRNLRPRTRARPRPCLRDTRGVGSTSPYTYERTPLTLLDTARPMLGPRPRSSAGIIIASGCHHIHCDCVVSVQQACGPVESRATRTISQATAKSPSHTSQVVRRR